MWNVNAKCGSAACYAMRCEMGMQGPRQDPLEVMTLLGPQTRKKGSRKIDIYTSPSMINRRVSLNVLVQQHAPLRASPRASGVGSAADAPVADVDAEFHQVDSVTIANAYVTCRSLSAAVREVALQSALCCHCVAEILLLQDI